jgi:hypothetical protein
MSTIQKIKEKKENTVNPEKSGKNKDTNNWSGFFTSLLTNLINLVILVILGGNLIFCVRNMGIEKYLPTNLQVKPYNVQNESSLFNSFPYKKVLNPQSYEENIQNWFAETLQYSWSFNRGMFQELFQGIKQMTEIQYPNMENVKRRLQMEKITKLVVDSLLFVFSPIILIFLSILAGTIGFFTSIFGGYKNTKGIIHNIFGLTGGYFMSFIVSFLQSIWAFGLIAFKPFTINIEHVFNTVKEFRGLILFLSVVFILSSAMNNLSQGINIGLIIGLIVLFGGTIIAKIM